MLIFSKLARNMEQIIALLLAYKYPVLILLAIIEGPIVSILAGLLVSLHDLNFVAVYLIVVFSDIMGDTLYYSLGRFGGKPLLERFGKYLGITAEKLATAKIFFQNNRIKNIILAKLLHGIGFTGLIAAGVAKIPYRRYMLICFLTTLFQAAVFLLIGILFGHAYLQINRYLSYFASVTIIIALAILVFILAKKYFLNFQLKQNEKGL